MSLKVLSPQFFQRDGKHIEVIRGTFLDLDHLDHIPSVGKRHIAQREVSFLVNDFKHRVDIGTIKNHEIFRIPDRMGVLLQDGDAEPMKRVDVTGIVIPGKLANAVTHLVGSLVGEGCA